MLEVEFVGSFGCDCEIAANLRRFYNTERALPFDWLIIPVTAIPQIIADNFDLRISPETVSAAPNSKFVIHAQSGIHFHHDFPQEAGAILKADWREHIPTVAAKYEALRRRWIDGLEQAQRAALFLNRTGGDPIFSKQPTDEARVQVYRDIAGALSERFPNTQITLAVSRSGIDPHLSFSHDNVEVVPMPIHDHSDATVGAEWKGSPSGWDEALSNLNVRYSAAA